ncbi:MAG: hypothetical protein JWR18_128, partial [Segetibacter sp.]|nr:hypothetical protein [Segetibacter sp.]
TQTISSKKNAALSKLTAGIAYEIHNPLDFVNNFLDVNTELIEELQHDLNTFNVNLFFFLLQNTYQPSLYF